ncbi:MAG TPA: S-layer homology domain-containing protein [Chloroflexia bacterium]|jgi:hypothetical protein
MVSTNRQQSKHKAIVLSALVVGMAFFAAWTFSQGGHARAASLAKQDKPLPPPVATAVITPLPGQPTFTPIIPVPVPTGQPGSCLPHFSDVASTDWFFEPVKWAVCRGVAGGYSDGTFRPGNNSTRAQIAKIVVLSRGMVLRVPDRPSFTDVPTTSSFYVYIETAAYNGVVGGYSDGTFRPGNDVTRAQLSKMTVLARGWTLVSPATPTFADVAPASPFYTYIETVASRGVVGGYEDGTFRPGNNATRAQLSKIMQNAFSTP